MSILRVPTQHRGSDTFVSHARMLKALHAYHDACIELDMYKLTHYPLGELVARQRAAAELVVSAARPLPLCNMRPERDVFAPCAPEPGAPGEWWRCPECELAIFPPL